MSAEPKPGDTYLSFDGTGFVEVPSLSAYSVDKTGELTVAAWMRPDVEEFSHQEGTNYVHWMGKGTTSGPGGDQEWACRMYSKTTTDKPPRPQRTSFYVFNPQGHLGVGSYVPGPVGLQEWRLIVGMADLTHTYMYRNGERTDCDTYRGPETDGCSITRDPRTGQQVVINPLGGSAPLRIGTQSRASFFQGGITRVRIWGRVLTDDEILALYQTDAAPRDWLVAEFLLDKDTGTQAVDTAYENHGVISGGATWAVQGA
jgi:Concanavalin A-like lectin/glucanases superfamily